MFSANVEAVYRALLVLLRCGAMRCDAMPMDAIAIAVNAVRSDSVEGTKMWRKCKSSCLLHSSHVPRYLLHGRGTRFVRKFSVKVPC